MLVWFEVVSDGLLFLAYASISLQLAGLEARYGAGLPSPMKVLLHLFQAFILLCGVSHLAMGVSLAIRSGTGHMTESVDPLDLATMLTKLAAASVSVFTAARLQVLGAAVWASVAQRVKTYSQVVNRERALEAAASAQNQLVAYLGHEARGPLHVLTASVTFARDAIRDAVAALRTERRLSARGTASGERGESDHASHGRSARWSQVRSSRAALAAAAADLFTCSSAARDLSGLVGSVLDFSLLRSERLALTPERVNVVSLLRNVARKNRGRGRVPLLVVLGASKEDQLLSSAAARTSGVHDVTSVITVEAQPSDLPETIVTDGQRLEQAVCWAVRAATNFTSTGFVAIAACVETADGKDHADKWWESLIPPAIRRLQAHLSGRQFREPRAARSFGNAPVIGNFGSRRSGMQRRDSGAFEEGVESDPPPWSAQGEDGGDQPGEGRCKPNAVSSAGVAGPSGDSGGVASDGEQSSLPAAGSFRSANGAADRSDVAASLSGSSDRQRPVRGHHKSKSTPSSTESTSLVAPAGQAGNLVPRGRAGGVGGLPGAPRLLEPARHMSVMPVRSGQSARLSFASVVPSPASTASRASGAAGSRGGDGAGSVSGSQSPTRLPHPAQAGLTVPDIAVGLAPKPGLAASTAESSALPPLSSSDTPAGTVEGTSSALLAQAAGLSGAYQRAAGSRRRSITDASFSTLSGSQRRASNLPGGIPARRPSARLSATSAPDSVTLSDILLGKHPRTARKSRVRFDAHAGEAETGDGGAGATDSRGHARGGSGGSQPGELGSGPGTLPSHSRDDSGSPPAERPNRKFLVIRVMDTGSPLTSTVGGHSGGDGDGAGHGDGDGGFDEDLLTATAQHRTTGLGHTLARELVQLMGGRMVLRQLPPEGAASLASRWSCMTVEDGMELPDPPAAALSPRPGRNEAGRDSLDSSLLLSLRQVGSVSGVPDDGDGAAASPEGRAVSTERPMSMPRASGFVNDLPARMAAFPAASIAVVEIWLPLDVVGHPSWSEEELLQVFTSAKRTELEPVSAISVSDDAGSLGQDIDDEGIPGEGGGGSGFDSEEEEEEDDADERSMRIQTSVSPRPVSRHTLVRIGDGIPVLGGLSSMGDGGSVADEDEDEELRGRGDGKAARDAARRKRAAARAAARPPKPRPLRVLFVDDDEIVRTTTRRMLERLGAEPIVFEDGDQVEPWLRAHGHIGPGAPESGGGFDLVLSDVLMPGMDGESLCARLADLQFPVPVVAATGTAAPEALQRFPDSGFCGVLCKPYGADQLGAVLEAARQRQLSVPAVVRARRRRAQR
ncbi:hypothetical protein FNF27_00651 [Cafeteria roenbergensis]|uniref:histidine kinase n=2 Tax=Cafeteria roenbergensis TaxID=33653 RepID=A0A5A8EJF5_CAFRO|nr:hypothetical protein FNF27_00651 [Cafeteria roenbergensis]